MNRFIIEHEQEIIDDLLKGDSIKDIQHRYHFTSKIEVYEFINIYCQKNNCEITPAKNGKGREIVDLNTQGKRKTKIINLESIKKIYVWTEKHHRMPRENLQISVAPKEDQDTERETPEQLEKRYHNILRNMKIRYSFEYDEQNDYSKIEDETDREILEMIREMDEKYSQSLKYRLYREALELLEWCKENNRKPEKPRGIIYRRKAIESEGEKEKELRMYRILQDLKNENKTKSIPKEKMRVIQDILDEIEYICNEEFRKETDKKLIEGIINLAITRKATAKQIEEIAKYYNVDIDEVLKGLEEESR